MEKIVDASERSAHIVSAPGAVARRLLALQRRRLRAAFEAFTERACADSVLEVGAMPTLLSSAERTTAYRIGAGRPDRLPYADALFDWVFCGETIEHVEGYERQADLVRELGRVARKGVFVTTSNRRHPLEFNTGLPLVHWLPAAWWQRIQQWLGKSGLHLLDSAALYRIATALPGEPKSDVGHKRIWGLKAHFFLMIDKRTTGQTENRVDTQASAGRSAGG